MKKCKKQFAVLLSVLLMLAMMPATAFAAGEDGEVAFIGETGYPTLAAAVAAAADGATITVSGDCSDEGSIAINDKSLTIIGEGADKPVVKATFDIAHSQAEEPCTVTFENLRFEPYEADYVIAESSTNATSADNVNQLIVRDCEFYLTVNHGTKAAVAIVGTAKEGSGTGTVTGAKLIFTHNAIETDSYEDDLSGAGYCAAGVSTSATESGVYGASVYSYAKHEISENRFLGHLYYAYVGGYADFSGNFIDLKYGMESIGEFGRGMQVRGAKADNNGGQLELTVTGNTFQNIKEVFKMYTLDTLINTDDCWFELAGTSGAGANTFVETEKGKIPSLGSANGDAAAFGNRVFLEDMNQKEWQNIEKAEVVVQLSQIVLDKKGELEMDKMTVSDGSQVNTYTQIIAPPDERTGFYTEADGEVYWYFATLYPGTLHFFLDDYNNVYVSKLVGGGNATQLVLNSGPQPAYEDMVEGHLYKADFSIETDDFNNTYYNAGVEETADTVILEAKNGKTAADVNAFISDIGDHTSLYVTAGADAQAPDGALKLVVPKGMGQLLVSGDYTVTLDADINNVNIVGCCKVTVSQGKTVTDLEICEETAAGSTLINDGKIGSLHILARTEMVNNGEIDSAAIGENRAGGLTLRKQKCEWALDSVLHNEGTIKELNVSTRAEIYNGSKENATASIDRLIVGNTGLLKGDGLPYATDSRIINYGVLCGTDSVLVAPGSSKNINNDIYLYTRCYFENLGIIGREGRGPWADHQIGNQACEGVGGMIYIGYYGYSDAHDGLIFVNSGTIYTGARHNGTAHQCYTLFLSEGKTRDVAIEVYNVDGGQIHGSALLIDNSQEGDFTLNHTLTNLGNHFEAGSMITTETIKTADYTAVDEAIEKVPDDLSIYTKDSVKTLNDALDAVVRGLDLRSQLEVDAMAEAIEAAIAGLQKIEKEDPDGGQTDTGEPDVEQPGTVTPGSDEPGSAEEPEKTGDESNLALWMLLLTMTGLATAGCAALKRKEN